MKLTKKSQKVTTCCCCLANQGGHPSRWVIIAITPLIVAHNLFCDSHQKFCSVNSDHSIPPGARKQALLPKAHTHFNYNTVMVLQLEPEITVLFSLVLGALIIVLLFFISASSSFIHRVLALLGWTSATEPKFQPIEDNYHSFNEVCDGEITKRPSCVNLLRGGCGAGVWGDEERRPPYSKSHPGYWLQQE